MRYLITYTDEYGDNKAFYTEWFDVENHMERDMIVFDIFAKQFIDNRFEWIDIEIDQL